MIGEETLPNDFKDSANKLFAKQAVVPREFIDVCLIFEKHIDCQDVNEATRNNMVIALVSAGARAAKGSHDPMLKELARIFLEAEDDYRAFSPKDEDEWHWWQQAKSNIHELDKRYAREPLERRSGHLPAKFKERSQKLDVTPAITKRAFIDLCLMAIACIDANKEDQAMRNNMAYHIAEFWYRNENIRTDKLLAEIGAQFGQREEFGGFNIDYILDGHAWEKLKSLILEADRKYPITR